MVLVSRALQNDNLFRTICYFKRLSDRSVKVYSTLPPAWKPYSWNIENRLKNSSSILHVRIIICQDSQILQSSFLTRPFFHFASWCNSLAIYWRSCGNWMGKQSYPTTPLLWLLLNYLALAPSHLFQTTLVFCAQTQILSACAQTESILKMNAWIIVSFNHSFSPLNLKVWRSLTHIQPCLAFLQGRCVNSSNTLVSSISRNIQHFARIHSTQNTHTHTHTHSHTHTHTHVWKKTNLTYTHVYGDGVISWAGFENECWGLLSEVLDNKPYPELAVV